VVTARNHDLEPDMELQTQTMNLPPQRPRSLLALLGLVVVVELLTVLVVENWVYDFCNSGAQLTMQAIAKSSGHS
jgi:hypothetical protein